MAEASKKETKITRRVFNNLLVKGALITGAASIGLVLADEILGRLFGRQEKWPDTPLFSDLKGLAEHKPINKADYLLHSYKIMQEMDKETLPDNIERVSLGMMWQHSSSPLDQMYFEKSGNKLTGGVTRPVGSKDLNGFKEINQEFSDIRNKTTNPLTSVNFDVRYSYKAAGKNSEIPNISNYTSDSLLLASHNTGAFIEFYESWPEGFDEKKAKFRIGTYDSFSVGAQMEVGQEVERYFDEKGDFVSATKSFYGDDGQGMTILNTDELKNLYVSISDWYNNKAKEAGK